MFACIRVLSESVACTPLEIYDRETKEKAREFYLYDFVKYAANEETTPYELKQWALIDYYRKGYCIILAPRDNEGRVAGLYPLPAAKVSAVREKDSGELFYLYAGLAIPSEFIVCVKSFFEGSVLGSSVVEWQRDTLGTSKATEDFAAESFGKGTFPSGLVLAEEEASEEDLKSLKDRFSKEFSGSANAGSVIISNAVKDFKQLKISNLDAQMIESRKFMRSVIAGLFRVPAHLINDLEKATFSNVEHLDLSFVKHTLRPIAKNFEERFNFTLLTKEERKRYYFEFNFNDLLRGDLLSRVQALSQGINNGLYTPNEGRAADNRPPKPGGDRLYINSSIRPIEEAQTEGNNAA